MYISTPIILPIQLNGYTMKQLFGTSQAKLKKSMYKGTFHQSKHLDNDTKQVFKPHSLAQKIWTGTIIGLCEPAMAPK
jgi:hypothetical protein